jgi:glycosyltransferase involved in cell wall biosynthesis
MKNSTAVICALARDCAQAIQKNIPRIEALRKTFSECDVLIIENDSKDNTKVVLQDWAQKSQGVYVICNNFGTVTIPTKANGKVFPTCTYHRIEKMARYRNMYLEWVEKQTKDYQYVVVLDIDVYWFSPKNIAPIIQKAPEDWGAICANGKCQQSCFGQFRYYDLYAFLKRKTDKINISYSKEIILQDPYTAVFSAFGGLAIYKYTAIQGLRYQALPYDDEQIEVQCEHVSLNAGIADRGYKLYIAKNLKLNAFVFEISYRIKLFVLKNKHIKSFLVKHHLANPSPN